MGPALRRYNQPQPDCCSRAGHGEDLGRSPGCVAGAGLCPGDRLGTIPSRCCARRRAACVLATDHRQAADERVRILQALQQLKGELPELRLAVTAIASLAQAYLAAKAGADIAAIFNGPLDQAEDTAHDMIAPIRQIYTNYSFSTKILACGRYPRLFGEIVAAGADICTMRMEFMRLLYEHSLPTRLHGFLKSWQSVFGDKTWPGLP